MGRFSHGFGHSDGLRCLDFPAQLVWEVRDLPGPVCAGEARGREQQRQRWGLRDPGFMLEKPQEQGGD